MVVPNWKQPQRVLLQALWKPLESMDWIVDIARDFKRMCIVDSFGELISLRSEVNSVALLL